MKIYEVPVAVYALRMTTTLPQAEAKTILGQTATNPKYDTPSHVRRLLRADLSWEGNVHEEHRDRLLLGSDDLPRDREGSVENEVAKIVASVDRHP